MTGTGRNNCTGALTDRKTLARRLLHWWRIFAAALGRVNTMLLLGVLFLLVVTPIGLLGRLFRKEKILRGNSAWTSRSDDGTYERQF